MGKSLEMISEMESSIRKGVGALFLVASVILYSLYGPLFVAPWTWFIMVGVGVGVLRTGVEKE